jgi:hypothetical protein
VRLALICCKLRRQPDRPSPTHRQVGKVSSQSHVLVPASRCAAPGSAPTSEKPEVFNSLYVTNFSPHYDGDDISRSGSWLEVSPLFVREPLTANLWPALRGALDSYGRIPSISQDGLLA